MIIHSDSKSQIELIAGLIGISVQPLGHPPAHSVIVEDKHLKFRVNQRQPDSKAVFNYDAVGWRMAQRLNGDTYQPGDKLDLAFTISMNDHPEFGGLELNLEDFRKSVVAVAVH